MGSIGVWARSVAAGANSASHAVPTFVRPSFAIDQALACRTLGSVSANVEFELKLLVPPGARRGVAAEMARPVSSRTSIGQEARYFDTRDRRLLAAGLVWRVRCEGRRWVQALKARGATPLERFEHEVIVRSAQPQTDLHAGTPAGDRLVMLVGALRAEGIDILARIRTRVTRVTRRVRTPGAVVEIAWDRGSVHAGGSTLALHELEFELVRGAPEALLALAQRWRRRFGLVLDPRTKVERGDCLAEQQPDPPVRKAAPPLFDAGAAAHEAFGAVLDECLLQINLNAIGLIDGAESNRIEHVHQLRVGIRRLRSALRCFRGWTAAASPELVQGLRRLFDALGQARDVDVLTNEILLELARAGGPSLGLPAVAESADVRALMAGDEVQDLLFAWLTWSQGAARLPQDKREASRPPQETASVEPVDSDFAASAARRLRRWHRAFAAAHASFDGLDDAALHELRKRTKRQRYAIEFLAPLLRRRDVTRHAAALVRLQERLGALNDLIVARERLQARPDTDPAVSFALGWLAARIAQARHDILLPLARLAVLKPARRRQALDK